VQHFRNSNRLTMKCEEISLDMFVESCLLSVRDIPTFGCNSDASFKADVLPRNSLLRRSGDPADVIYCSDIRSAGLLVTDRIMRVHSMARSQL
jgi:hypothetical protein